MPEPPDVAQVVGLAGEEFDGSSNLLYAKLSADGELIVSSTEREQNVGAGLDEQGITSTGAPVHQILVDLDGTTAFPHDETGRIDISSLDIELDLDATAQGRVRFGVITRVDATDADISYFAEISFSNQGVARVLTTEKNWAPSQVKLGVDSNGNLKQFITDNEETGNSNVNTGTDLDSPNGATSVTPAVGDVIVKYEETNGGTYDAKVHAMYHSEASA